MSGYAGALGLTLAIEVPVYVVALRLSTPCTWRAGIVLALAVNLVSHPLAFLVVEPALRRCLGTDAALVITEVAVVLGEAAMMHVRRVPPRAALLTSACANITSLVMGVALTR